MGGTPKRQKENKNTPEASWKQQTRFIDRARPSPLRVFACVKPVQHERTYHTRHKNKLGNMMYYSTASGL